jgi:hypothetical protein
MDYLGLFGKRHFLCWLDIAVKDWSWSNYGAKPGSIWHYFSVIQQVGQRGRRTPEVTESLLNGCMTTQKQMGAFHSGRQMRVLNVVPYGTLLFASGQPKCGLMTEHESKWYLWVFSSTGQQL